MYWIRVRSRALRVLALWCPLVIGITTPAYAEPASDSLVVTGFGTCPAPEAVRAKIFQLTSPASRAALSASSRVSVNDQGASFRVSVTTDGSDAERTYSDPGRSCERRARFAAVFAIVTLMPPDLGFEADAAQPETLPEPAPVPSTPAMPVPPPPVATRPEREAPRRPAWLRLELAAVAEQALNAKAELAVRGFGGELTAAFGRGHVSPSLSIAYAPNRELAFADATCILSRAQLAAGARYADVAGSFAVGAELGVAAALARVRGNEFEHPAASNALDFGVRARVFSSLAAARVGPLLALEASAFPWPTEVQASPRGALGNLPILWFGVSFGAYLGL